MYCCPHIALYSSYTHSILEVIVLKRPPLLQPSSLGGVFIWSEQSILIS